MLVIQKYGGSSLADIKCMENAAKRIISYAQKGCKLVVVLSAQGSHTDELLNLAKSYNHEGSKRELDMLLACGEQQSIALMSLMLARFGYAAKSLNAFQAGITTNSNYTTSRIKNINTARILSELEQNNIVIVAGFQGINHLNDITTLGRGGSDTTAVALSAALNATLCEIYTDVDGVYSADPRIVKNAKKLKEISYFEMLEMAALGAKVLQKRSVGLAKKYGVKLIVSSSFNNCSGTTIKEECLTEDVFISGVALDIDIIRINICDIIDAPGAWFKVFSVMNSANISIDFIQQTKTDKATLDISFTIGQNDFDAAKDVIQKNKCRLGYQVLKHNNELAKLSVVSSGMATHPGVPSIMFEALFDAGVTTDSVCTSEIRTSVLINRHDAKRAANAVHNKFLSKDYIKT